MNTGVVQPHNSLRNEILLNSLQLGLPPAIFCHNSLFIELMCQISILIEVQGTSPREYKRCGTSGAFESSHGLFANITG